METRDINKKMKGMKFDLIVSNPPYNKGLDLKILESVLYLSDNICFVHPATWLLDEKGNKRYDSLKQKLINRFNSIELLNGFELFNIGLRVPVSITNLTKNSYIIDVKDNSLFYSSKNCQYKIDSIEKFSKYGFNNLYQGIKIKILNHCKSNNVDMMQTDKFQYKCNLSSVGLNTTYDQRWSYCTIFEDRTRHFTDNYPLKFSFTTEVERNNFCNYLRTKFARFCLSIFKINQALFNSEPASIPWFDFSKSWSDEECAKELGITNEELLWMIQQIPDFYKEDAETYRKLEKKLEI